MKLFSKSKAYIKEEDKVYCALLNLARVTDKTHYNDEKLAQAVEVLNQLPQYAKIHQRIIPLLCDKAHKLTVYPQLLPQTQQLLSNVTQQGVVTELAKLQQLSQLIELLTTNNISVMLLKGVAFNHSLYSNDAPRTSTDIDILIKKSDWPQAVSLISNVMDYCEKDRPDILGDLYELSFKPKEKIGAALDLHSSLTYPKLFTINERGLWQASTMHPYFNNEKVRMLSPEHALAHQALHAYKDMNFCKYNLVDSHELISQQPINIDRALKIAKGWGTQVALHQLLKNCQQIMGSEIAPEVIEQAKPSYIRELLTNKLLNSRFTQPFGNKKPVKYRMNQLLSQFVFTSSIARPLSFQWLFVKALIKKDKKNTRDMLPM